MPRIFAIFVSPDVAADFSTEAVFAGYVGRSLADSVPSM